MIALSHLSNESTNNFSQSMCHVQHPYPCLQGQGHTWLFKVNFVYLRVYVVSGPKLFHPSKILIIIGTKNLTIINRRAMRNLIPTVKVKVTFGGKSVIWSVIKSILCPVITVS
jgi:hypothetical protein